MVVQDHFAHEHLQPPVPDVTFYDANPFHRERGAGRLVEDRRLWVGLTATNERNRPTRTSTNERSRDGNNQEEERRGVDCPYDGGDHQGTAADTSTTSACGRSTLRARSASDLHSSCGLIGHDRTRASDRSLGPRDGHGVLPAPGPVDDGGEVRITAALSSRAEVQPGVHEAGRQHPARASVEANIGSTHSNRCEQQGGPSSTGSARARVTGMARSAAGMRPT